MKHLPSYSFRSLLNAAHHEWGFDGLEAFTGRVAAMPFISLKDLGLYGSLLRIHNGQPVNNFLVFSLIERGLVEDKRYPRLTAEGSHALAALQASAHAANAACYA